MNEELTKVVSLSPVKGTLEKLRIGGVIQAPRHQRASIKQAISRIKDECKKRFSIRTVDDYIIEIKRKQ